MLNVLRLEIFMVGARLCKYYINSKNETVYVTLVYVSVAIEGFHGAWLHFRSARVGVCVQHICVMISAALSPYH